MKEPYLLVWDCEFYDKERKCKFYAHRKVVINFENDEKAHEYFKKMCLKVSEQGFWDNEEITVKTDGGTVESIEKLLTKAVDR